MTARPSAGVRLPLAEGFTARMESAFPLQGAVPGPHTGRPHPSHRVYPYVLGHMQLGHSNLVWPTGIT